MKQFYKTLTSWIIAVCCLWVLPATAQLVVAPSSDATALANAIVGSGITISNATLMCGPNGAGSFASGNNTNLGLDEGILLTSGLAAEAAGPASFFASTAHNTPGDPDLANLVGGTVNDACVLQFEFTPSDNHISVQYVFGSEEYPDYVCSNFNDVFGFFVSGPNPDGGDYTMENVALVPGTSDPVTINNINGNGQNCPPHYPEYYVSNNGGTTITYNGFTVVLTAEISVTPGEEYMFKFAIGDVTDAIYDSGVFIKGSSFSIFLCQAGQVGFNPNLQSDISFCTYDADKTVQLYNNVISASDAYEYLLLDDSGEILAISSTGEFDLDGYAEGTYSFHGISYSGIITGFEVGNNVSDIAADPDEGCFELSPAATAEIEICVDIECPDDITISCDESTSPENTGNAEVTGDPDNLFTAVYTDEVSGTCPTVITRTWSLEGPTSLAPVELSCVQIITVEDEEAPVISGEEELTVECDSTDEPTFSVEDNCDENPDVSAEDVIEPGDCSGYYTIIRTITAEDNCGNTSTFTQTINVVDTTAPEFNEEIEDFTVECEDDVPAFEEISATDNCSAEVQSWSFEFPLNGGDTTCVLTDAVGPGVDWSIVLFNFPGATDYYVFNTPGSMEMYNDGSAIITGTVEAINNPAQQWDVFIRLENKRDWNDWSALGRDYKDDLSLAGMNYIDWNYYEMDNNNSFLIGAGDFNGSFLQLSHMPVSYLFGFQCGVAANNKNANFGLSGWFHYEGFFNGTAVGGHGDINVDKECEGGGQDFECLFEIERFYIAVDDCGNTNVANQTITVEDTTGPEFTVTPDDLFFDCYGDIPAPDASQLEAEDNCGGPVVITFAGDILMGSECDGVISRSYDAVDECGNLTKYIQTITIADTLAPVLNGVPADLELSCEEEVPAPANVTASDNCDTMVNVIFSEMSEVGNCPQNVVITRTWTASDSCGNEASATQIITITDETAPVITECPEDAHYTCIDDVPAANIELVSATDNCGMVTITHVGDNMDGDECEGTITRTYIATDECGNSATCVQVITYNDDVAPEFINTPESQISVDCASVPEPEELQAEDNCSEVNIEFEETFFSGGCPGVIQRVWTATDQCGNQTVFEQFITLVDTVAPTLHNLPADATYECDEEIPAPAEVTATDNCDADVIVHFEESTEAGDCPQEYTIYRTWSATDTCENSVSHTQVINIVDTTAPVFDAEDSEMTVACDEEVEIVAPVATDNCDSAVQVEMDMVSIDGECVNEWTEIYTWTATDACGNSSSVSLTVNYIDEEAPEFTEVPEDLFFDCIEDVPAANVQLLSAIDNCGDVIISHEGDDQYGDDCAAVISRTYRATDECGNYTEYVQTITVADTLAPVLAGVPMDTEASCDDIPEVANVTASDNCDDAVNVIFSEMTEEGECPQSYTIIRTWTATDSCGNTATASQSIYVFDNVAPVITECPEDAHYDCIGDVPAPNTELVSATDNCGMVSIVHVGDVQDGDECEGTITRTYRAIDECGNSTDCVQVITYNDDVAPVFINAPGNVTLDCADVPDPMEIEVADNCSEVDIDYSEVYFSGGCPGVIERTWVITDQCGNSASHVQYINLIDTIAPTLHNLPADATYECDEEIPGAPEVWATDNCDEAVDVIFEESTEAGECPNEYTIYRTWSANDTCENSVSHTQVINVVDTTAPEFDAEDSEITVDCHDGVEIVAPVATDNCDSAPMVELVTDSIGGDCPNEWTEIYTWTATDACGNSSSVSLTVNYVDDTPPAFTMVPEDLFFECMDDVPAPNTNDLAAIDNCGDVVITHEGDLQEGDDCDAVISRTYRATDECNNYTEYVQIIVVIDTVPPVFDDVLEDITVSCDNVPGPVDCYAEDNCTNIIAGFFEEIEEGCPTIITRTWTATDLCGNMAVQTQVITVVDTIPPVITECPEDESYDCISDIPAPDTSLVSAEDSCNDVIIVHHSDVQNGDECEGVIIRTYRAYDECENYSECVQIIEYNDNVAPIFVNAPGNTTADCDSIPDAADVIAEDNCSEVSIEFTETLFSGGCAGVLQRIWVATDACGNSTTHEQFITLIDEVAPELHGTPADLDLECDEDVPAPAVVTVTDNCDMEIEVEFNETIISGECAHSYSIVRTWTAIDECGNEASHTQTITISDNTAPELSGEDSEMTVDCDVQIELPQIEANDNCDMDVVAELSVETVPGDCPNEWTEIYTWTATDDCGNSSQRVLTVNYVDDNGPTFTSVPMDLFVECIEDVPAPNTSSLGAIDNCGEVEITHEGDSQMGDDCSAVISRVYRATDLCDNYVEYTQIIVVADTIAPVFDTEVASVIEAECDDVPEPANLTATDNCGLVEVMFEEEMEEGDCEGSYTLYRTWTAIDACDNYTVVEQTVIVSDNTPPVLVDVPADASYNCTDSIPAMEDPMAWDNCSSTVTVISEEHVAGYTGEDGLAQCDLTTPLDVVGAAWALWLPNSIGEPQYYHLTAAGGQFVELPNGRAHLTGTAYAPSNPDKRWVIDVYFKDRADWDEWNGVLGRSYKDDANFASAESLFENWDYYILNADSAVLTGDGLYAGSELSLSHAPASYFFGFQVGEAANNRNAADGMSGWFFYNGQWIGNEGVNGIGDFAFEKDCPECDYTITRIWTAIDDCGNETTEVQIITVQPSDEQAPLPPLDNNSVMKNPGVVLAAWPNPTAQRSVISFEMPNDVNQAVLEVLSMDGKVLSTLYRGDVAGKVEYRFEFDGSGLNSGIYIYRLMTDNATYIEKLMLVK